MEDTVFYVIGLGLVALAVVISVVGLRSERFPPSAGAVKGGLLAIFLIVAATCAAAVVLAREEQDHRRKEFAEYFAENEAEASAAVEAADEEAPTGAPPTPSDEEPADGGGEQPGAGAGEQPGSGGEELSLASPEDGSLVFDPTELEAAAGSVTIVYTNPSPVPHNVALESSTGETLDEGEVVSDDESTATAELEPGEYVFYCAVPGHRDAGMEGTLTVE